MLRTRRTRPLLRQVNGQQHATADDHEADPASSQPADPSLPPHPIDDVNVDVYREPDELSEDEATKPVSHFEKLTTNTALKEPLKRKSDSESDGDLFPWESSQAKRQKRASKSKEVNKDKKQFITLSSPARTKSKEPDFKTLSQPQGRASYDSSGDELAPGYRASQKTQQGTTQTFKARKPIKKYGSQGNKVKPQKTFVEPKAVPKVKEAVKVKFKAFDDYASIIPHGDVSLPDSPMSSPLSSLPEEFDNSDIEMLDLTGMMRIHCEVCQQLVALSVKEEYEDRFNDGKQLTITRQRAFCNYHKRQEAQRIWNDRGYPDIDWSSSKLGKRMTKQHPRLIKIIKGDLSSVHRDELAAHIASRQGRTVQSAMSSDLEVSVGYYGPRGQKVMLEHISVQLARELREEATKDALMGSAGVGGGVSGFVQNVLVPEMATGLIAEDMNCSFDQAKAVLEASKEVGEVLCDELRERIVDVDADDQA